MPERVVATNARGVSNGCETPAGEGSSVTIGYRSAVSRFGAAQDTREEAEMSIRSVRATHAIPARAAAAAAERFRERVAFRYRQAGEWRTQTFAEVGESVDQLALGLVARGLEPGDRICILANTRPEWTLVSLAISRARHEE